MKKQIHSLITVLMAILSPLYLSGQGWSVNSEDYSLDMSVIVTVELQGEAVLSPNTKVAAFINNEVRGVASVSLDGASGLYKSTLTVLGNASGGVVTFKFYIQEEDTVYETKNAPLIFKANELIGTWNHPLILIDKFTETSIPVFSTTPSLSALAENQYTYTAKAEDYKGNNAVISATSLPSWLSFDSNSGTLSGTSPENGTYTVELQAQDNYGFMSTQTFEIAIRGTNTAPEITSVPLSDKIENGALFVYAFEGSDADGDPLQLSAETIPDWITFTTVDATFGRLEGTVPTDLPLDEKVLIRLSLTDGYSEARTQTFYLTVNASACTENTAPEIISMPSTDRIESGTSFVYILEGSDANGDALTLSAKSIPDWLTFSQTDDTRGRLEGTVPEDLSADQQIPIRLSITDGLSESSQVFYLTPLEKLSTPETTADPITIYPNPTSKEVSIHLNGLPDASIRVYDTNGAIMHQAIGINQNIYQFNLEAAAGVYMVEVTSQNTSSSYQLIKQ